jgi:hypothetical protein
VDRGADRGADRDERQRAAAAEAERLAREHSNKREQKARQERARSDDGRGGSARPAPAAVPGSPVARPVSPTPVPSRTRVDGGRSDPGRPVPARGESQHSVTAVERPVERHVERPVERPSERSPGRTDDQPRVSVISGVVDRVGARADVPAPRVQGGFEPPPSAGAALIDDVAVEAEELLREAGGVWSRWSVADRISAAAAVATLLGTFLPWLWRKNADVVLGIGSGGVVHAAVAVLAIALLVQREAVSVDERGMRLTRDRVRQRGRRTALWLLLLSLVSTVAGTWLLLVWGAVRRFEVPDLEIGTGLYLTLAAGLGLSYSGFAFFWRR